VCIIFVYFCENIQNAYNIFRISFYGSFRVKKILNLRFTLKIYTLRQIKWVRIKRNVSRFASHSVFFCISSIHRFFLTIIEQILYYKLRNTKNKNFLLNKQKPFMAYQVIKIYHRLTKTNLYGRLLICNFACTLFVLS